MSKHTCSKIGLCLLILCRAGAAHAGEQFDFYVPAGRALSTLKTLAHQANDASFMLDPNVLATVDTRRVEGVMDLDAALAVALDGTLIGYKVIDGNTITFRRLTPQEIAAKEQTVKGDAPVQTSLEEIVVKGGFLADLSTLLPTITVTRQQLEAGGYHQLGEFFRHLPQNFVGVSPGSSPIVGNARGAGDNQTSIGLGSAREPRWCC